MKSKSHSYTGSKGCKPGGKASAKSRSHTMPSLIQTMAGSSKNLGMGLIVSKKAKNGA